MYSLEEGLGNTFARTTTTVLRQLAEVPRELEDVVGSLNGGGGSELPHMFRHTTLSYHHVR